MHEKKGLVKVMFGMQCGNVSDRDELSSKNHDDGKGSKYSLIEKFRGSV